jgi:hypothetical protein
MATDTDTTTETDETTQDDPQAVTAAEKAGADKATETLKAEAERLRKALSEANRKALADRKRLEDIDKENEARETAKDLRHQGRHRGRPQEIPGARVRPARRRLPASDADEAVPRHRRRRQAGRTPHRIRQNGRI